MCQWDLERAVERYFNSGGDLAEAASPASIGNISDSSTVAVAHFDKLLGDDVGPAFIDQYIERHRRAMPQKRSPYGSGNNGDPAFPRVVATRPGNRDVEYDSDGMRKPDPIKRQRLLDYSPQAAFVHSSENRSRRIVNVSAFSSSARATNSVPLESTHSATDLATLYAPPQEIMLHESYIGATTLCKEQCKWLLVNIQKEDVFDCHVLTRDVWSDSTIKELIKWSFLFWQQIHVSEEGQQFIRLYNVKDFPYIAIIDPRNATIKWSHAGPITYDTIAEKLQDFIGSCDTLETNSSGANRSSSSSHYPDIINISDDATNNDNMKGPQSNIQSGPTKSLTASNDDDGVGVIVANTIGGHIKSSGAGFPSEQLRIHFTSSAQMSSTLSVSVIGKLNEYILNKWGNEKVENDSTFKMIKIRFEITNLPKMTLEFPVNVPLYIVALVLSLHLPDEFVKKDFELFTKMPRKGLCSQYLRGDKSENNLTIRELCNDHITLRSIGITADTVLVVEFLTCI